MNLIRQKIEKGYGTTRLFLKSPMAESLQGKKVIRALDFGCGDGCFTVGMTKALATHFKPEQVRTIAINADMDNGGALLSLKDFDGVKLNVDMIEAVSLMTVEDATVLQNMFGVPKVDFVSIFNPGPPDELMQLIMMAHKAKLLEKFEAGELEKLLPVGMLDIVPDVHEDMSEHWRRIARFLTEKLSVDPEKIKEIEEKGDLERLIRFCKRVCLEQPLAYSIPELMVDKAPVMLAFDNLIPKHTMREILNKSGYKICLDMANDPENIFSPMQVTSYNSFLIGATKN